MKPPCVIRRIARVRNDVARNLFGVKRSLDERAEK